MLVQKQCDDSLNRSLISTYCVLFAVCCVVSCAAATIHTPQEEARARAEAQAKAQAEQKRKAEEARAAAAEAARRKQVGQASGCIMAIRMHLMHLQHDSNGQTLAKGSGQEEHSSLDVRRFQGCLDQAHMLLHVLLLSRTQCAGGGSCKGRGPAQEAGGGTCCCC
jgi:hypothetical protein